MLEQKIFDIEVSVMDQYVIDRVREIRAAKGISQMQLSQKMGLSEGTVARIERPGVRGKYNLRHINLLAKALDCSPKDFFPDNSLEGDKIKAKVKQVKNSSAKKGEPNYQIISKKNVRR